MAIRRNTGGTSSVSPEDIAAALSDYTAPTLAQLQAEATTPAELDARLAAYGLPTLAQLQAEASTPAEVAAQVDARLAAYGAAKVSDLASVGAIQTELRQFAGAPPAGWTVVAGPQLSAPTALPYRYGLIPGPGLGDDANTQTKGIMFVNPTDGWLWAAGTANGIKKYNASAGTWSTVHWSSWASNATWAPLANGDVLRIAGTGVQTVASYNPNTGWTTLANYPEIMTRASAVLMSDGKVFVAGGADSGGTAVALCRIYDPVANTWDSTVPNLPSVAMRTPVICAGANGKVYHFQGTACHEYDPVSNTWATRATCPSSTTNTGGAGRLSNGNILLVTNNKVMHIYNPTENTWTAALGTLWSFSTRPIIVAALPTTGDMAISHAESSNPSDLITVYPESTWCFAKKN